MKNEEKKYNLSELREEYVFEGLDENTIEKDPFKLFDIWFKDAVDKNVHEPNAMTIATADKDGKPSARMVLLKDVSKNGFVFYTNYESRKGKEIASNPNAAILFWWDILARQIRIEGKIEKISEDESEEYFNSRPVGSKIGAIVSDQSRTIPSYKKLEEKYNLLSNEYKDGNIPKPGNWGGYRVTPDQMEFWQGRQNRLHDRILFRKSSKSNWTIERLSP